MWGRAPTLQLDLFLVSGVRFQVSVIKFQILHFSVLKPET